MQFPMQLFALLGNRSPYEPVKTFTKHFSLRKDLLGLIESTDIR